ncbi:class I SAM-dependent methyltransferase [Agromyces sp. MMS24-K17]|uniref:class I SAM-dependent methyltransferase n=1 Tax=Agromyces sp. MMS24-K17 TaxID=3372850 RepID=UPI003754506D
MVNDVRAAYSARAAEYAELFDSMSAVHRADLELVTRWADGLDGPVLDAGCGPGHWTDFLAGRGLQARGVDQVPEFVDHARARHPGVPFRLGSVDELDEATGSVGGVLAWYSLIHHEPVHVQVPLREFARVLRPGGSLLLGCFEWPELEPFDHAVVTAYRWPIDRLRREVQATGFDVIETHTRAEDGTRPQAAIVARRTGGAHP